MSVYVEGTQRGYAVGIRDGQNRRITEVHFDDDGTAQGIAQAYMLASNYAERLKIALWEIN